MYKIVQIGDQVWFAENLNYETDGSWCYGENSVNCEIYGRLYHWDAAIIACPNGWKLPSEQDWGKLIGYLGGDQVAHIKMAKIGAWSSAVFTPTNESGFSAIPTPMGSVFETGVASWWEATQANREDEAWYRNIDGEYSYLDYDSRSKSNAISCRCVKD